MKDNDKKVFQNYQRIILYTLKINKFVSNCIFAILPIIILTLSISKVLAWTSLIDENSMSSPGIPKKVCPIDLLMTVRGEEGCAYKTFLATNCAGEEFIINLPCTVNESSCNNSVCLDKRFWESPTDKQTEDAFQNSP